MKVGDIYNIQVVVFMYLCWAELQIVLQQTICSVSQCSGLGPWLVPDEFWYQLSKRSYRNKYLDPEQRIITRYAAWIYTKANAKIFSLQIQELFRCRCQLGQQMEANRGFASIFLAKVWEEWSGNCLWELNVRVITMIQNWMINI